MYQYLEPKSEVTILSKRSKPQGTFSSPHDSSTSMSYWLKSNIQGDATQLYESRPLFPAQTGHQLLTLPGGGGGVAFSPDGKRVANVGGIWDNKTGLSG